MIIGKNLPTTKDNVSAKNAVASKAQSSAQTSKPSLSAAQNIPRTAASLISAAGLPADKLSSSIVSFLRFFSLPLKPQMLADMRRNVFAKQSAQTTQQSNQTVNHSDSQNTLTTTKFFDTPKGREVLALVAAASESKGVELSPKGLESYAHAVDPDSRQNGEGRKQNKEKKEKDSEQTEFISAEVIKKKVFDYLDENPLIDILNKLPCKNGQRWIVLPFDFSNDGKEYKVSMRILIDKDKEQTLCMALDITISSEQLENSDKEKNNNDNRQVFVMEIANEKPVRVSVYLQPGLPEKKHTRFKEEISSLFDIPIERIFVKNNTESFPYESGCGEDLTPINEVV
ncbi:MAG: hypothetical protein FWD24_06675 [Treponema sp.]|nr:hypothetical protein [Treponema sp.]